MKAKTFEGSRMEVVIDYQTWLDQTPHIKVLCTSLSRVYTEDVWILLVTYTY